MNKSNKIKLPQVYEKLKENTVLERFIELYPFDYSEYAVSMFVKSMKYVCEYQMKKSSFIKKYYSMLGFNPSNIKLYKDVDDIPFVYVGGFKERNLTTLKKSEIVLELKSSGTSGQVSRIQLDLGSLIRVRRMAYKVFDALGLVDLDNEYSYICFTYDPNFAGDVGTAWTDNLLTSFTKTREVYYSFKWDDKKGEFYFDVETCIEKLKEYEEKKEKVRLIGFPAFVFKMVESFKERVGRYPKINPSSFVITGGGWKNLSDEAIDKKIYRKILADNLSIPVENIRDLFGMVEHGVPYVDCKYGNFHIPIYGRVIARDPISLEDLGYNKKGLLEFMTPYLTSYPSFVLLSSDWGMIKEGCDCGIKGPVLEIHGRAGVKKLKGCAISASTMLK